MKYGSSCLILGGGGGGTNIVYVYLFVGCAGSEEVGVRIVVAVVCVGAVIGSVVWRMDEL